MTKTNLRQLVFLWLVLSIAACGSIETEVSRKDQTKQLLNEGKFEEAVALLRDLKKEDPADFEIPLLLASAYAGKSKFNIVDSFAVFQPFMDASAKKASLVEAVESTAIDIEAIEKKVVKIATGFSHRFQSFDKIPYIVGVERAHLVEALLELKEIPQTSDYYHRARSYSAILNALQFANYLRDAINQPQVNTSPLAMLCNIDFFKFAKNIDRSVVYLVDSIDDLKASYRKYSKKVPSGLYALQKDGQAVVEFFAQNRQSANASEIYSGFAKHGYCD